MLSKACLAQLTIPTFFNSEILPGLEVQGGAMSSSIA